MATEEKSEKPVAKNTATSKNVSGKTERSSADTNIRSREDDATVAKQASTEKTSSDATLGDLNMAIVTPAIPEAEDYNLEPVTPKISEEAKAEARRSTRAEDLLRQTGNTSSNPKDIAAKTKAHYEDQNPSEETGKKSSK